MNEHTETQGPPPEFWEQMRAEQEEHLRALRDAEQRIYRHPYNLIARDVAALVDCLRDVFNGNQIELLALIDAPSRDWRLSHELTQDVQRSVVAERYNSELSRRLHNFVTSAYTVTECSKAAWTHRLERHGGVKDKADAEFTRLKMSGPVDVDIVSDLRRYSQHAGRLTLVQGHRSHFTMDQGQTTSMTHTVVLSSSSMLDGNFDWKAETRAYLETHEDVVLRDVVRAQANHWFLVNEWVIRTLIDEAEPLRAEANDLIAERNAILTGMDIETARAETERITEQWWADEGPSPFDPPAPQPE